MVHRGTRSEAAQDRRAERGSLHRQEEPHQVSGVKLLERSECGRPATLRKEKEINALSHGYSRADCRGNERDAAPDCGGGRPAGGGTPSWRKPRQSGTGVGQVDDTTCTAASSKVGGHKGDRSPVKLRQRRGEEVGEEVPSAAEEDAELHHQCIPVLREPLEWAAMTAVPITHQLVDQRFGSEADPTDQVTDLEDTMHQVFAVLMQVTEVKANDIVCNSSGMELEAWRKLTRRWNPLTWSRLGNLLGHVISPGRASLTKLPGALERWEEQVFEVQELQESAGAGSRHTRGHLDGSLGIVGSDRSGGSPTDE